MVCYEPELVIFPAFLLLLLRLLSWLRVGTVKDESSVEHGREGVLQTWASHFACILALIAVVVELARCRYCIYALADDSLSLSAGQRLTVVHWMETL